MEHWKEHGVKLMSWRDGAEGWVVNVSESFWAVLHASFYPGHRFQTAGSHVLPARDRR